MKRFIKYVVFLPALPINIDNYLRLIGAPPILPAATDELLAFRIVIGFMSLVVAGTFVYLDWNKNDST